MFECLEGKGMRGKGVFEDGIDCWLFWLIYTGRCSVLISPDSLMERLIEWVKLSNIHEVSY